MKRLNRPQSKKTMRPHAVLHFFGRGRLFAAIGCVLLSSACNLFSTIQADSDASTDTGDAMVVPDVADVGEPEVGPADAGGRWDGEVGDAAPDAWDAGNDASDVAVDMGPACDDGRHNGDETDVDCGGSCPESCPIDAACLAISDCAEGYCLDGFCGLPTSCQDLLVAEPPVESGDYEIYPDGQTATEVFCEMTREGGGWTRVTRFDAEVDACPGDWSAAAGVKACTRNMASSGFRTASFTSPLPEYSDVMGFVRGYQYGSMDQFDPADLGVDAQYVDGVGIALAEMMPRHVWTYAVSWSDDDNAENSVCPCLGGRGSPATVGDDFYCEAGLSGTPLSNKQWYLDDPLWDGDGAGTDCDTNGDPSWFLRTFQQPSQADLRVRLIADQPSSNEDVGVTEMELYVR